MYSTIQSHGLKLWSGCAGPGHYSRPCYGRNLKGPDYYGPVKPGYYAQNGLATRRHFLRRHRNWPCGSHYVWWLP